MSIENSQQNFGDFEDLLCGQTPEEVAQELVEFRANQIKLDGHVAELITKNTDLKGWAVKSGDEFTLYKDYEEMFSDLENRGINTISINVMKLNHPVTLIL